MSIPVKIIRITSCDFCPNNEYIDFGFGGVDANRCTKLKKDNEIHTKTTVNGFLPNCPLEELHVW